MQRLRSDSQPGTSVHLRAVRKLLSTLEQQRVARAIEEAEHEDPKRRSHVLASGWTDALATEFLAFYDEQDERLVQAGFHRTSRWWRSELERFIRSGRRRWLLRVGRQGGKSSTLTRVYVAFARWKHWAPSMGTLPEIPLLSQVMGKAKDRFITITAILDALGEPYEKRGDLFEMKDLGMCFRVTPASTNAVGMTAIVLFCDEVSRWPSGTAANPAKLVLKSAEPSMITQPLAFSVLASTPFGELDYHAELCDLGDDEDQIYSHAPTWVATDGHVTEEETHRRERDPLEWSINYAAIPQASLTSAFEKQHVAQAFKQSPKGRRGSIGWVACDPSQGMRDGFAYACGWSTSEGELVVAEVFEWGAGQLPVLEEVCATLASKVQDYGAGYVFADHYEQTGLTAGLAKLGVAYWPKQWTVPSKEGAFSWLRRKLREGRVCVLVPDEQLKREMERCPAEIRQKTGKVHYETTGLDKLSCLVSLAHGVAEGLYRVSDGGSIDWAMVEEMQGIAPGFFPG